MYNLEKWHKRHPDYSEDIDLFKFASAIVCDWHVLPRVNNDIHNEPLPENRDERMSDLVAVFHGYGITRRQYIDLLRLYYFQLYSNGFDQDHIDQSLGTLDLILNDNSLFGDIKYTNGRSNAIHYAYRTYHKIINNLQTDKPVQVDVPELLIRLYDYEHTGAYNKIGTQCYQDYLSRTSNMQNNDNVSDDYQLMNVFSHGHLTTAARQFLVY